MRSLAWWYRKLNPQKTHPVTPPPKPAPRVDPRIAQLKALGMVYPVETLEAATAASIASPELLSVLASILIEETGGGRMDWGHDPENFAGGYDHTTGIEWGELVTERSYKAYKAQRASGGEQGCGSGQLTDASLQDQADALGGCWLPGPNLLVTARFFGMNVRKDGLRAAVVAYNGSGPRAEAYADTVLARAAQFAKTLT